MAQNPLRKKLQSDQITLGLWATLESASITEIAVALNIDWVVVDVEHGHLDYKDVMDHICVVLKSETSVIIRVPDIREDGCVRFRHRPAHLLRARKHGISWSRSETAPVVLILCARDKASKKHRQ